MKKLSVIIPCYNESNTIETLLSKVDQIDIPNWTIEVVIVDDGSKDGTRDLLKKYSNKYKIIFQEKNGGKGTAVKTGIDNSTGDYLIIQDADLEYEPAEIKLLVEELDRNPKNIIYGSRNLHHVKRKGMYIPRMGVWFVTKQFNFLFNSNLTDLWTCYKLFPKEVSDLFVSGGFDSELIFSARVAKKGYKISEVPISHKPRSVKEGKKIKYRDGIKGIIVLLKEFFR
jgi:glycosyltransferase involved in cell wall biosynthesis